MWKCRTCQVPNDPDRLKCEACEALNIDVSQEQLLQNDNPFMKQLLSNKQNDTTTHNAPPPNDSLTPSFGNDKSSLPDILPAFTLAGFGDVPKLAAPQGDLRRTTFGPGDDVEHLTSSASETATTGFPSQELTAPPPTPSKASTPGFKSPTSFCQAMNTPVRGPGVSSPFLLGDLEPEDLPTEDQTLHNSLGETKSKGVLYTWGSGECGQLAVRQDNMGDDGCRPDPIIIKRFSEPCVTDVICGSMHSCAITVDGSLYTWGCEDGGALGRPVTGFNEKEPYWQTHFDKLDVSNWEAKQGRVPAKVYLSSKYSRVVKVSAGGSHTAVITDTGECYCWGSYRDHSGPIGFLRLFDKEGNLMNDDEDIQCVPLQIPLRGVAVDIASGENHTVALTVCGSDRFLYIWGSSEFGQCLMLSEDRQKALSLEARSIKDLAVKKDQQQSAAAVLSASAKILHVYTGKYTTFIMVESEGRLRLFGCGRNPCGELGAGFMSDVCDGLVEVRIPTLCKLIDIRGGDSSTVALGSDGSVWCWGRRDLVGLGTNTVKLGNDVLEPSLVMGLKQKCSTIGIGTKTTYAGTKGGQLFAWGDGETYQLTEKEIDCVYRPRYVKAELFESKRVHMIAAGAQHVVALVLPNEQVRIKKRTTQPAPPIIETPPSTAPRSLKRGREESNLDIPLPLEEPKRMKMDGILSSESDDLVKEAQSLSSSSTPKIAKTGQERKLREEEESNSGDDISISEPPTSVMMPNAETEPMKESSSSSSEEAVAEERPGEEGPEEEEPSENDDPPKKDEPKRRVGRRQLPPAHAAAEPVHETAKPKGKAAAESKTKAVAEPKAKTAAEPKVKAAAEPKAKAAAEPKAKAAAEPKANAAGEPVHETVKPKAKAAPKRGGRPKKVIEAEEAPAVPAVDEPTVAARVRSRQTRGVGATVAAGRVKKTESKKENKAVEAAAKAAVNEEVTPAAGRRATRGRPKGDLTAAEKPAAKKNRK